MRINSAGAVGISNTNPLFELCIGNNESPNRNGIEIAISGSDAGTNIIQNYNRATSAYTPLNIAASTMTFGVGTSATERMRITSDGQIKTQNRDFAKESNYGYSSTYKALVLGSTGTNTSTNSTTVSINYDPSGNAYSGFSGDGREVLFRRGVQFVTPNSADDSMYLYNLVLKDGSVGIGTSSPSTKLHTVQATENWIYVETSGTNAVAGLRTSTSTGSRQNTLYRNVTTNLLTLRAGTDDGEIQFIAGGSATERMRIDSSGNVGIGTTSPASKLEVYGGGNTFRMDSAGNTSKTFLMRNVNTATAEIKTDGNLDINIEDSSRTMRFLNGNTERMRIDSSGRVGIGTTSPSRPLHVNGVSTVARFQGSQTGYTQGSIVLHSGTSDSPSSRGQGTYRYNEGSDICWYTGTAYSDTNKYIWARRTGVTSFATDAGEGTAQTSYALMTLVGSSGYVGIGESNPASTLVVRSDSAGGRGGELTILNYATNTVGNEAALNFGLEDSTYNADLGNAQIKAKTNASNAATDMMFSTWNGSSFGERMRIKSNGNVGIGVTSPTYKFHVASSNNVSIFEDTSGSSGATFCLFNAPSVFAMGSITRNGSATSVLFNTSSDYRLKEDLQDFNALDLVDNITAYDYKWKDTEQRDYGFVAHELQEVMPNVVSGEKDGEEMQKLDYSKLTPVLLKAIQELKQEIETLKAQINN